MATEARPTKRERREQRRAETRRQREESQRRARTQRYVLLGLIGALVVLGAALAYGPITENMTRVAAQGQQYPDQGRAHINVGAPHEPYNSNPPTSGPHYPDWARWGVHEQPLPDEQLVHNLEHGGIVVHYNCPDGCPELVEELKAFVSGYRSKVVLAPRPNPDVPHRITLSAWTWLDGFDQFDAGRIRAFIETHRNRGPELVPD